MHVSVSSLLPGLWHYDICFTVFVGILCCCVVEFFNVTSADSEQRQSELLHHVTQLTQFMKVVIAVFVVWARLENIVNIEKIIFSIFSIYIEHLHIL